jgi:hypothetical protein
MKCFNPKIHMVSHTLATGKSYEIVSLFVLGSTAATG